MAKHTPGPWWFGIAYRPEIGPVSVTYSGPGFYDNPMIYGADGQSVVGCDEYDIFDGATEEERRNNIRLLLAAPDLLAALKLTLATAMAFEKQASKGTGGRRGGAVFTKARAAIAKAEGGDA